ncbi:hypothetical protein HIM_05818 [Hirsutella minnesotensis 3608]|uniref:Enterotoxin n=1 Tax=Hirsutella minnesotensis 3608 TaxID=1043627 RepID=A0A0F7ZJV0_9HYPO|nr:hypothetical protein HIM_05818 [Hirsutella minnesotensis 3608]
MRAPWTYWVLSFLWSLLLLNNSVLASPFNQTLLDAFEHFESKRQAGQASVIPKYVFRGVGPGMTPEKVKLMGGLFPNNRNPASLDSDAYRLTYHLDDAENDFGKNSAYASASSSIDVATYFAKKGGWVYTIKTTPNMVPIASSVYHNKFPWEREYAALGGIKFEQILECAYIPKDSTIEIPEKPDFKSNPVEDVSQNMEKYRQLLKDGQLLLRNEEITYNQEYESQTASAGQPQLAGYIPGVDLEALESELYRSIDAQKPAWKYAREFLKSIGKPNGWSARFPLFRFPAHAEAIKQEEQEAQQGTSQGAATTEGTSTGEVVADVLYEMSPVKPFADLVDAIRSDREVPVNEWLGILGEVGLEVLAWTPTPAAPGIRALKFARAGFKASEAIKKGIKIARGTSRAVKAAERISTGLDKKLNTVEVKVPTSPAGASAPASEVNAAVQPVSKIAKAASEAKVPKTPSSAPGTSKTSAEDLDRMMEQLEGIKVPDDPVVPVMIEVVKEAGKKIKKPTPAIAERSTVSPAEKLAIHLENLQAAQKNESQVPLEDLNGILEAVEEKLRLASGQPEVESFLDNELLWGMLVDKFDEPIN